MGCHEALFLSDTPLSCASLQGFWFRNCPEEEFLPNTFLFPSNWVLQLAEATVFMHKLSVKLLSFVLLAL
jgi:hypothetical protein